MSLSTVVALFPSVKFMTIDCPMAAAEPVKKVHRKANLTITNDEFRCSNLSNLSFKVQFARICNVRLQQSRTSISENGEGKIGS